jgi:hypothetical protein
MKARPVRELIRGMRFEPFEEASVADAWPSHRKAGR